MEKEDINKYVSSAWKEKVYIETAEHVIKGYVFMPKIGKRNRLLTEILNSNKQFLAVTDCTVELKRAPQKEVEKCSFLEVNISTILIMRPIDD